MAEMTVAEALRELDACRLGSKEAAARYDRARNLPYGTIGRVSALDDAISDALSYAEREQRLRRIIDEAAERD